jgi:hypothetical protein
MSTNDNLPNIISNLQDGNLNTSRQVDLGDRVLVIGTSSRGPINQPIRCQTPDDAASVFGSNTVGTLVRGMAEVYYGPNGTKDIWCCRISNGKEATLDLYETLSAELDELPTYDEDLARVVAMTVEALEPGDIYNSVTFRQTMYNGQLSVICYNPVTGLETVIPYDPTGITAGSVSDTVGLANAINLDPNMGKIVKATVTEMDMSATFTVDSADVAVSGSILTLTGDTLEMDLNCALTTADTSGDGYTDSADVSPSGIPVTSGNRLVELVDVYELSNELVELKTGGYTSIALPYPVQQTGGVAETWLDLDGNVSGGGIGKHKVVNAFIATADGTVKVFPFTAYEAIDITTFKLHRTSSAGTTVEVSASDFDITSVGGSENDYIASVTFKTTVAAPTTDSILTVTYDSEEFALTKASSLAACRESNSYRTYFPAGDRVNWGTAQPCDIVVCYPAQKTFEVDVDVVISDAENGIIQFGNPDKQPNYTAIGGSNLYISWKYQPGWVDLGTGALALTGGSNGVVMTNAQKYSVLEDCYEALADFETDCIVLMNSYLDDIKRVYDEETGLPVNVNAGFGSQLEAFLESLQDGVNETYGIIAVKPADSPSAADVADWYEKMTVVSQLDKTRAANVMQSVNYRHLSIVAFEPIIANPASNMAYVATGEAIYAGIVCKLPITSAPTWKNLGTQVPYCRYKLSPRQANVLTGLRYVTATLTPANEWKITDAPTAAAIGSDYARFSTIRIVFAAMDVVRACGSPFIGNLFGPVKRAALDTAIQKSLYNMKDAGALANFEFKIEQTAAERVLGIGRVNLVLWPEFELRRIEVTVKLSNS